MCVSRVYTRMCIGESVFLFAIKWFFSFLFELISEKKGKNLQKNKKKCEFSQFSEKKYFLNENSSTHTHESRCSVERYKTKNKFLLLSFVFFQKKENRWRKPNFHFLTKHTHQRTPLWCLLGLSFKIYFSRFFKPISFFFICHYIIWTLNTHGKRQIRINQFCWLSISCLKVTTTLFHQKHTKNFQLFSLPLYYLGLNHQNVYPCHNKYINK